MRQKIYDTEAAGIAYMSMIYLEADMKFPKWKVHFAMELDLWMYEYFNKHGKFPYRPIVRAKRKELAAKHKSINY